MQKLNFGDHFHVFPFTKILQSFKSTYSHFKFISKGQCNVYHPLYDNLNLNNAFPATFRGLPQRLIVYSKRKIFTLSINFLRFRKHHAKSVSSNNQTQQLLQRTQSDRNTLYMHECITNSAQIAIKAGRHAAASDRRQLDIICTVKAASRAFN
jgi:hypothetical protein